MGDKKKPGREEPSSFLEGAQKALDDLEKKAEPEKPIEQALLGLLLKKHELYYEVIGTLRNEYFTTPYHQEVFLEMQTQMAQRHYFDPVTLRDALNSRKESAGHDGMFDSIVAESKAEIPEEELSERAKTYAERIRENHYRVILADYASRIGTKLETGETPLEEGADQLYKESRKVLSMLAKRHKVFSMPDALRACFQQIEDIRDRKSRLMGISTGYYELDDITSGLMEGQLYVIGGRPSMGKTSLQTSILENIVLQEQKPALFFSLEMGRQEIATRMLCSHARVDSNLLRSGKVSESDYQRLVLAAGALHESRLFIIDDPLTIEEITRIAHDYRDLEHIGVVAIDHLQKIKGSYNKNSSREQDIGYVSRELKNLAKTLKIPVIVSAQLNRSPEATEDRRPELSSLRESGEIEQEADVVGLLYREDYYNEESDKRGVAELLVKKNRNGPTKTIDLAFLKQFTRFENLAKRPDY